MRSVMHILILNVKKHLLLLQPRNVISHEAPDKEGIWKCSADLDVKIFLYNCN